MEQSIERHDMIRTKVQSLTARRKVLMNMMTCRVVRSAIADNTRELAMVTGFDISTVKAIYR